MSGKEDAEKAIDCITEQEREFAQSALSDFQLKNYNQCLQNLAKLEGRSQEFKVLHNKHVAEYLKSDLKKTEQYQKNMTTLLNQFHLNVEKLDDVDYCVAYYNQAVLLFHKKQYTTALNIMDRVYKFIEPMDEVLTRQVGLLLVELYLSVRQVDKAVNLITYLHNHELNQATPTLLNTTKVPIKHKPVEKEKKPAKPITKATEDFLKVLDRYRIRCNLLNHSLKVTGTEIQTLYQGNKLNAEIVFLLANHLYLKGNFMESAKLLTTLPADCLKIIESGESSTVLFYNNMGVIHHAMGKHNLASHYYQKALQEEKDAFKNIKSDSPLYTIGSSKYHELMYNLGISLLYAGKAIQAFECLVIAVRRYHRNSRLWLRLAECCIQVHKESNAVDFDIQKKQRSMVVDVIDKDAQKFILTTNVATDKKYSSESQSYAVPVPTLEFALICLRNAKNLLPSPPTSSPVPLLLLPGGAAPAPSSSPGPNPSSPLDGHAIGELRNGILAASAYVGLCLGDYIVALEHAETLLAQPKVSGVHKLLGHLYAAESLVLLDNLSAALEHLNPNNIKDIELEIPEEIKADDIPVKTKPPTKWFPDNMASIMAVMQYNVAVVKTIRGQFDQAAALLKQIWQGRSAECKVPAHIIMLMLYIELQLGHAEVARTLIKQHSIQRFNG